VWKTALSNCGSHTSLETKGGGKRICDTQPESERSKNAQSGGKKITDGEIRGKKKNGQKEDRGENYARGVPVTHTGKSLSRGARGGGFHHVLELKKRTRSRREQVLRTRPRNKKGYVGTTSNCPSETKNVRRR